MLRTDRHQTTDRERTMIRRQETAHIPNDRTSVVGTFTTNEQRFLHENAADWTQHEAMRHRRGETLGLTKCAGWCDCRDNMWTIKSQIMGRFAQTIGELI